MSTIQESARDLIGKGAEVVSGIAASAGVAASKAKIKMKAANLSLEEGKLMQELGQAAYETLGDDPDFRAAHADILARIDEVIAHRHALEAELDAMDDDEPADDAIDVDAIVTTADTPDPEKKDAE